MIQLVIHISLVVGHNDVVTCLSLSSKGKMLATGSKDTTVCIWELYIDPKDSCYWIRESTKYTLYGHDDEVSSVSINCILDTCISCSKVTTSYHFIQD